MIPSLSNGVDEMTPEVDEPLPAVKLKSAKALLPPLSFVTVFVTRSVPYWMPGVTMQSNGLLLPPLPADGYEQTLARRAPVGTSALATWISRDVSCGWASPGPPATAPLNGSVSFCRLPA